MNNRQRARVVVVGPLPPPVGGVETMTVAVLASPALADFDVLHCDLTKGRPKDTQGAFDVGNMAWACIHCWRMLCCVASFRPDIVYMPLTGTWSGFWRDGVLATIGGLFGARIIGHVHGGGIDRMLSYRGPLGARLVKAVLRRFDTLLVLGSRWYRAITQYGYDGTVAIVPPTLDPELAKAAADYRRNYRREEPKGLFVGHVGVRKGVLDLLEAVRRLRDRGHACRVTVVGPPQRRGDWERVVQRRRDLGLEGCVELTGPLEGEALYQRYREADFFVLPSYIEGLPIVFLEAGAFGLPVIGTPVGAVCDLMKHEHNALLVTPGDVEGLAESIGRLHRSSAERERLGRQLRSDVERFSPEVVCTRIRDVICGAATVPRTSHV